MILSLCFYHSLYIKDNYISLSCFRKEELYDSCAELGIPEQNIIILKHSALKDDPNVRLAVI